jgi:hypothetical protein
VTNPAAPDPWLQISGEPSRLFDRFLAYLHLGPARTNVAAAKVCGVSEALIRSHAKAWSWRERAQAYDRERLPKVSDRLREAVDDDRREALLVFRDSQHRTAQALNACALLMLRGCVRTMQQMARDNVPIPVATLGTISSAAARLLEQSANATGSLLGLDEIAELVGLDNPGGPTLLPGSEPETADALEEITAEALAEPPAEA